MIHEMKFQWQLSSYIVYLFIYKLILIYILQISMQYQAQ